MKISHITEGLMPVPQGMYDRIMRIVYRQVLWFLRDKFRGKTRVFPQHYVEFAKLVKQSNVNIPRERFKTDIKSNVFAIPIDLSDMPNQYRGRTNKNQIYLVFDWTGNIVGGANRDTRAAWYRKRDALIIYMLTNKAVQEFPSNFYAPTNLAYELESIGEAVEHELRHMVQYVLIQHPEQTRRKPGYAQHDSEYFTSPVEFDPMIGSAVRDFLAQLQTTRIVDPVQIRKRVDTFTGNTPRKILSYELFAPATVFRYLKKVSPKRWRIAVKKFTTAVSSELARQRQGGV